MRTLLVTGADTGIGKTHVVGILARRLARTGGSVQVVKAVETGVAAGGQGDAERARQAAGPGVTAYTLASFSAAIAPAAAAASDGQELSLEILVARAAALPPADWRIYEGAGGIATPVDDRGRDWADFGSALDVEAVVIVVADRLGAINQARLAFARAAEAALPAGVWLNAPGPVERAVADSNRAGLLASGVPVWGETGDEWMKFIKEPPASGAEGNPALLERWRAALAERDGLKLRRSIRVTARQPHALNLSDNDYLDLARDPAVAAAAAAEAAKDGTSASASPLITGWRAAHASLVQALCAWHRFPCGLLWNSGYAANSAVLGTLPQSGDLVLADRLIHHSMIAGLRRSGARLQRYAHLDLNELERRLAAAGSSHPVFVVTESVFSMDGDYPDLARMAELKRRFGFFWIVDEAHALGWYGPEGSGLARAIGVESEVDVLVGTLGKTLASGGAYGLFRDEAVRDTLVNFAGEFIYSTALPPANAAAAEAALGRVRALAKGQAEWHRASRDFRAALRADGWAALEGDSPIVPVRLDREEAALSLADALRAADIHAAAVRPPTVPAGTSRLRFSLKRTFTSTDAERVMAAMQGWRSPSTLLRAAVAQRPLVMTNKGQTVKMGWVLGWAVPETWFEGMVKAVFPHAVHVVVEASPKALDRLEEAGSFDWVVGYSLGTLLLLGEAGRVGRLGKVALLAPIFAFPKEAGLGGKIPRSQVRQLARWLRRDPRAALADFYQRAGLDVPAETVSLENLTWGLERLENDRVEPPLPTGWFAWCGDKDPLLDAERLHAIEPRVGIVEGGTHHPLALLREFDHCLTRRR